MNMWGALSVTVSLTLLASGRFAAAWPIKTINLAQNCDTSTEQYLQVEAYDFHENPKITMTWRQVTGECGAVVSNPVEWTATYDTEAGDDPPDDDQRVQLNLFVCCPFGEYELELDVQSSSPAGSSFDQRTSWEIENGPDEYHIWDTVNTILKDDQAYSPTTPGIYKWPLSDATGYYSVLYAGPLPPIECESSVPAGTVYKGCYADSTSSRTLDEDFIAIPGPENPSGMTPQVCSDFCAAYDFFGVEYGSECFCGTSSEFSAATSSSNCGLTYEALCTGDSTVACGGFNSISIYERTSDTPPVPTPTPGPVPTPTPEPVSTSYAYEGCFVDSKSNRIMSKEATSSSMTAEVCFGLCDDGTNNYFGTQYSSECWCGVDPDLTANGEEAVASECDFDCAGSTTGETCGGFNRMSAYKISGDDPVPAPTPGPVPTPTPGPVPTPTPGPVPTPTPGPVPTPTPEPVSTSYSYDGCFVDSKSNRIMSKEATSSSMTAEVCFGLCDDGTNNYFGTQYSSECWCGVDPDLTANGEEAVASECDFDCAGSTTGETCGGFNRMSAYKISGDDSSSYIGCYADMRNNRAMPAEGLYSSGSMTNELCQERCSGLGYAFAGTQYGKECWCDDSYDTHGEADNCNFGCSGDSSQTCGGFDALSVYEA